MNFIIYLCPHGKEKKVLLAEMKANEVRIGNYLKPYHGECVIVTAIQGDGRIIHTPNSIGAVNDIFVSGIPLTPAILRDWCGFKISEGNKHVHETEAQGEYFYVKKDLPGIKYREGYSAPKGFEICFPTYDDDVTFDGFYYLHQLQNVVFALTGTELEIKIPA